jgi:hypothetical protein
MRTTNLALAMLAATILLSIAAGSAVALRSLSASSTTLAAQGNVTFIGSNGVNVICPLTLTGTVNRATAKRAGTILGSITRVDPVGTGRRPCRTNVLVAAEIVVALNLPWNVLYNSILGTLPRITGSLITVQRVQFLLEIAGQRCLLESNLPFLVAVEAGGALTIATPLRNAETLVRGLELTTAECPASGELSGELRVTTSPRVTLV